MLKLDKNTLAYFADRKATRIKVFFYDAGCSGMKVNIIDDFEIDESVVLLCHSELDSESFGKKDPESSSGGQYSFDVYIDKRDKERLENCSITRVVIADHTGKEKVRYVYAGEEVKGRCGCGSSFNFGEEKKPKLDLSKLREFKQKIQNQD